MADDTRTQAGKRFGSDLRSHREEHNLSMDDLHQRASVPREMLQSFESGRLMDVSIFNRVFLRSLARTYAASLGVPAGAALASLEAALNGTYEEGQLQREVEQHKRDTEKRARAEEQQQAEQRQAEEEQAEEERAAASEQSSVEEEAATGAGAAALEEAEEPEESEEAWSAQSPPGASPEARRKAEEHQRRREERAAEHDEARREAGRERDDRSSRRRRRGSSSGSSATAWVVAVVVVLALVVGAYFLFFRSPGRSGASESQTASATDTEATAQQQNPDERQPQAQPANLQLGGTINFTVVAQGGPVQEIRITRDQDVRRPYWIEEGQATVFPANQRIVLEQEAQLDKIRLLVDGYPYPTDQRDTQGRIVITRQDLQAFADTLRGQPASLTVPTDTAAKGSAP